MQHKITVQYQDELVTIEPMVIDGNVQFRANFGQPVFLEKELDEDGTEYWIETGTGATIRARELGQLIEEHPELM